MKGHVHIPAADMLRLRDAIHEAGACSAWNQIRHMADPELTVALANDGNHWAEWQRIAAGERQDYCGATRHGECECHRRMGADFYFLPAGACLVGDAKRCTDPARNGLYVHSDRPRPEPLVGRLVTIGPDAPAQEQTPIQEQPCAPDAPVQEQACHHHRLTKHCTECARERAAAGQQEHSEVLRAAGVPYHDDDAGEHECVLEALRQC